MAKQTKKPNTEIFFKDLPEVAIETINESYDGKHTTKVRVKAETISQAKQVAKEVLKWKKD